MQEGITKNSTTPLNREEEAELTRLVKRGGIGAQEAKSRLVASNAKLVISIAQEHRRLGLDLDDLISEGNIGLMRAIDKFDPDLGYRLSTYASWWVKEQMREAIAKQGSTIRIPSYARDKLLRVRKVTTQLSLQLERTPTNEEIAQELGLSETKIESILAWGQGTVSLEQNIDNETGVRTLGDTILDENAISPMTSAMKSADANWTHELLEILTEQEVDILKRRYGFDNDPQTLESIGDALGITRERVRQIENQALKKLRKKISQIASLE